MAVERPTSMLRRGACFAAFLEPRGPAEKALTAVIQEVQGASTRSVDVLVHAMGMEGISKSRVSRLCVEIEGRREVLGMAIGTSETETFWLDVRRSLTRRSLRGVKLVVSDAHEGLKAAVTKVQRATWQRCRVHFMRNAVAHAGKTQRRIVPACIGTAFAEASAPMPRGVASPISPCPRC